MDLYGLGCYMYNKKMTVGSFVTVLSGGPLGYRYENKSPCIIYYYSLFCKTVNIRENGMFIVSQTIRLEMKPQKISVKPQHRAGFFFYEKCSILPFSNTEILFLDFGFTGKTNNYFVIQVTFHY